MQESRAGSRRTGRWAGFTETERALIATALESNAVDRRQWSDADGRVAEPSRHAAHTATIGQLEELARQARA